MVKWVVLTIAPHQALGCSHNSRPFLVINLIEFSEIRIFFQNEGRQNLARQPAFFLRFPSTAHDFELRPVHGGTHSLDRLIPPSHSHQTVQGTRLVASCETSFASLDLAERAFSLGGRLVLKPRVEELACSFRESFCRTSNPRTHHGTGFLHHDMDNWTSRQGQASYMGRVSKASFEIFRTVYRLVRGYVCVLRQWTLSPAASIDRAVTEKSPK